MRVCSHTTKGKGELKVYDAATFGCRSTKNPSMPFIQRGGPVGQAGCGPNLGEDGECK